ncbi:chondroitin AC/alginate lyase [Mycena floridula]|nr:chondroitin AC/alginate lyase [Mycena floridula]
MLADESNAGLVSGSQKRTSNWIKIGIPVAVLVIVGAVVGGVLGSRAHKNNSSASSSSNSGSENPAAASSAVSAKNAVGLFATATNSEFMVPIYPSTTNSAAFSTPTFNAAAPNAWPKDSFQPSNPSVQTVRTDRPRLLAPAYKWAALPALIAADPYLKSWNSTIFGNATDYASQGVVKYFLDGASGMLDNARQVKQRVKAFAYAFRMSNDKQWVDHCWSELQNAAGNGSQPFGFSATDRWNSQHFLDVAEMSAAFAIAYDWLYDQWSDEQKGQIRSSIVTFGLNYGVAAYNGAGFGWWRSGTQGNWNCVCNSGLTMASLAILGDDDSGTAAQLLGLTIDNAKPNCLDAVSDDGTWAETANYWYFGTTGHAEMAASLLTATGSHYGLLDTNPNFQKTGDFHMYVTGSTSMFNWGDHGPNKYSTTANSVMFYASQYNQPQYTLFQRDRADAAEPWSMFWYDPSISGAFWDGKPLDAFFNNQLDQWASMRSSWTDVNALYVAVKAGQNQGHQNHNDLDVGDFVLDAMGTRWAGELGSGDYLAPNYFVGETQDADRWKYYRKMTEGQNTLLIGQTNQLIGAAPKIINSGSTGEKQGPTTVVELPNDSTAFWVADMTSAYSSASSVHRGVRTLNGRKQVLIQDEITATAGIQWRMHTNATIALNGASATLTLDNQTMKISILSPASATFGRSDAVRSPSDPPLPAGGSDQDNPGVSVLTIALDAGTYNLQVLFNPQWSDSTTFVTPPSVDLANWSLTSHN